MRRLALLLLLAVPALICGQQPNSVTPVSLDSTAHKDASAGAEQRQTLAINDELVIQAADIEGLGDRPFHIESDGMVTLPLVGRMRAIGLTLEEFEKELIAQLSVYVRSPRVSVRRLAAKAQTVVVAGAFKNPGIYNLSERRSLLDVLSAAGGLQPNAGRTIKIRRRLGAGVAPLPLGIEDPATGISTATVNINQLIENPEVRNNITLEPHDVIWAGPAGVVFLTGEVLRPGSFDFSDRESLGVTELISLAGGIGRDAAPAKTKILRPILNGSRRAEIPVDLKSILDGRANDFPVMPNDLVVVPRAKGKWRAVRTAALYAIPVTVSSLIYIAIR